MDEVQSPSHIGGGANRAASAAQTLLARTQTVPAQLPPPARSRAEASARESSVALA